MQKLCIMCDKEKQLTAFGKDRQRKDGLSIYCKECARAKQRKQGAKAKDAYREYVLKKTGLKCSNCGFSHNTSAPFDWHHTDPNTKEIEVSRISRNIDKERLDKELEKCVFLCKNCHAIEHEKLRRRQNKRV